jgi:hypothetical protein
LRFTPLPLTLIAPDAWMPTLASDLIFSDGLGAMSTATTQIDPTTGLPLISGNYSFLSSGKNNSKKTFGRLDYNLSDKNRINITVLMHDNPHKQFNSPICPISCQLFAAEGYNAQFTDVYTFNSSLVNEFRYSFVRQGNWFVPASLGKGYPAKLGLQFSIADEYPSVNIGGTGGNGTLNPTTNAVFIENTFIPSDVLTLVRGKHILHFGGEVMFEQDNSTPWGNLNGAALGFTGQYTSAGVGYADFLLGDVQSWTALSEPEHGMRAKNPSFFVQDDIKLRPNLTINLGVRSETHGGMSDVKNNIGGFDPPRTTQLFVADHAIPRRGITLVFVWNDCVRAP